MEKFKDTKEGDVVFIGNDVSLGFHTCKTFYCPIKVIKTTATQLTIENGERYNRNGRKIGGNYGDHIYLLGEKIHFGGVVNDQTKEKQLFIKKINTEREIKNIIESIKFAYDSKLSAEQLEETKSKLLEIKKLLNND